MSTKEFGRVFRWHAWLALVHLLAARWLLALPRAEPGITDASMAIAFAIMIACLIGSVYYFFCTFRDIWRFFMADEEK